MAANPSLRQSVMPLGGGGGVGSNTAGSSFSNSSSGGGAAVVGKQNEMKQKMKKVPVKPEKTGNESRRRVHFPGQVRSNRCLLHTRSRSHIRCLALFVHSCNWLLFIGYNF